MTKILVIAEHNGAALNPSAAKCVACATQVDGADIDIAVLGASVAGVGAEAAQISGVTRVVTVERAENDPAIAAILAPQIVALASDYSHVFGPSTAFGKDLMPRVAALLGVSASASAFWGGGPWGGSPWGGGGNDWWNDMMGDGYGDFNMNMSGGGRGFGRGYNRYRDYYGYGPYGGYGGGPWGGGYGGYGAPYYGGGYPYAAPYGAPPAAPAAPAPAESK